MATKHYRKTTIRTQTGTHARRNQRELTHLEEVVVRMRQGLSENDEHPLLMRGSASGQTRARLTAIEADALIAILGPDELIDLIGVEATEEMIAFATETMGALDPPASTDEVLIDHDLKNKILDRLSELK